MNDETYDFGGGPVPAHRHPNGGGWVADTAHVEEHVYVGEDARVAGGVIVGGAVILGGAVYGGEVRGGARILGGVIHDGEVRGGVIRGGDVWSKHYHCLTVTRHGYHVIANRIDGDWRISAGCRDRWTIEQAREHWGSPNYHTPSDGRRIVACLDWLESESEPKPDEGRTER